MATPQYFKKLVSGQPGKQIVPDPTDEVTNLVPPGMVEVVLDASVGNESGHGLTGPTEIAIIKQIHWGPGSWWYQGIAKSGLVTTTPNFAISNAHGVCILFPGERLGARAAISLDANIYIMYTGVTFPISELGKFLGLEGTTTSFTGQSLDLSQLTQAAQTAAETLTNAAAALTNLGNIS